MSEWRQNLEKRLGMLTDVEVRPWKDTDLICVYFRGKEFAHFQDHQEIDIRLSRQFIKKEGLTPLTDSPHHPDRVKLSRWMLFRFNSEQEVLDLVALVERLLKEEYENTSWGAKI